MYVQKVREACYCACRTRRHKSSDDEDEVSEIESEKAWKKAENGPKQQKKGIVYEDDDSENSESSASNHLDSNGTETTGDETFEDRKLNCACVCHGMYSNNLVETVAETAAKPVSK